MREKMDERPHYEVILPNFGQCTPPIRPAEIIIAIEEALPLIDSGGPIEGSLP